MAGAIRYEGRVAIVTGAGGGLGREYALLLAERGASVVVNDLGGTQSGEGKSIAAADKVVQEIRSKGGKAVADYNSVEDGEKIVKTAIDNYGRIDILINNAGVLRDKSFANMNESDWDIVHKVHLKGSFMVTKAAWPYLRKQKYGRIIMTASGAGIFGNFGQANYSSAKLGLLGLSNTLAIEGAKYDIHCNTIIPVAASRLTQDVLPSELYDQLKPSFVCPVVLWLCHENCSDNGCTFEAAGGWVGKYQWQRSIGKTFIPPTNLTIEAVRDNWDTINNMDDSNSPATIHEQMALLIESLNGKNGPAFKKPKIQGTIDKPGTYNYTQDAPILYALAVGMSTKEPNFLNFLYENTDDFKVLPTFGTIAIMPAVFSSPMLHEEIQKLNADPSKLLHGEQYLELYSPISGSGSLYSECKIIDVLDKGSGAVAIIETNTFDESGKKVIYSQWSVFLVGSGNFGGKRSSTLAKSVMPPPSRLPDSFVQEKTSENQAAIYRLCGDKNPMHIDPSFAAMGGFNEPILHGLCSLGYATRHVLKQYANYDVTLFKSVMARFANPIIPGHTIKTDMWQEGSRIHFQSSCIETGKPVISGAYIDLKSVAGFHQAPVMSSQSGDLKSHAVFATMAQHLKDMPELASKIQAVYQWNITKNGKDAAIYTVDLKTGVGKITNGPVDGSKPGCTLIIDDDDMIDMVTGKLDPQKAFMAGKLKLKGNIMLTQKLKPLLAMRSEAGKGSSSRPSLGTGGTPGQGPQLKSDGIFIKLGARLKKDPDLAATIGTVYQWNILKDGKHLSTWTLDLKNGSGEVYKGSPRADKPDCTFILEDDLFADMMTGKADPQRAFMSGKLKITGNVLASQKLQAIWENPGDEPDLEDTSYPQSAVKSQPKEQKSSSTEEPPVTLKSNFVFEIFSERLKEEPELAKKMKVVYHWNILKSGKKVSEWTVDLKTGAGSIYRGPPQSDKADVTLTMDDEDVIQLMLGKLNPQRAFMTGRLKIKGNIMLTQKLNQLWQEILKSGRAVELPILSTILADKAFDPSLRSEPCFVELGKKISRMPELISKLKTVFEWNITKNGKSCTQWILDLKKDKPMLYRGPSKGDKPTCLITVDDDIFANWILGKMSGNQMLSSGKLKVSGSNSNVFSKFLDSFKPQSKL